MVRGAGMMRRRSRSGVAVARPRTSRVASAGVFTGATAAALLATWPGNVTVSLDPEPGPVAVCQATLTLPQTSSGGTPIQRARN